MGETDGTIDCVKDIIRDQEIDRDGVTTREADFGFDVVRETLLEPEFETEMLLCGVIETEREGELEGERCEGVVESEHDGELVLETVNVRDCVRKIDLENDEERLLVNDGDTESDSLILGSCDWELDFVALKDGDAVVLIKDLKVKGSSITLKMGTKVKSIRLVGGDHEVDCKMDGGSFMLKACYLRKA